MSDTDVVRFGERRVRVYACVCGLFPVRPLYGDAKPCDHCDAPLEAQPFVVDDLAKVTKRLMDKARESRQ